MVAGLETLQAGVGARAMPLLHQPLPASIETFLTSLINALATIPHDFVVILDDYQVIQTEPIHRGVAYLLDHLPPPMHLVMATRADPQMIACPTQQAADIKR